MSARPKPLPVRSPDEEALYALLQEKKEALPEALAMALGIPPERVLSLLTLLELKGLARALPGGRYGPG